MNETIWFDVNYNTPDTEVEVLLILQETGEDSIMRVGHLHKDGKTWVVNGESVFPSHWTELPELPNK